MFISCVVPCVQRSVTALPGRSVQLRLGALTLLEHRSHALVDLTPGGVFPPHQTAGRLAVRGQWGRTTQGVLPATAFLFFLLRVLGTALQRPAELLQQSGALGSQSLPSSDPAV